FDGKETTIMKLMNMETASSAGTIRKRLLGVVGGVAGILILMGCSSGPVELVGDEDEAQTVLATALNAWQAGAKPDKLRSEKPAVHVADEDWQAGKMLKSYQVTGAPQEAGGHWRVSALLTLSADG